MVLLKSAPVYREHVRCLDGLRGLAVLMVLWAHSTPLSEAIERKTGFSLGFGYLGVEIFFVLSGFLITRILLWDRAQRVPLRYFLMRRFLRIFPIYYLMLAVVWFAFRDPMSEWAALYLSNYYNAIYSPTTMLSHTWSLAVEEHFYLLWPLVVCFLPRDYARKTAMYLFPAVAIVTAGVTVAMNYSDQDLAMRLIYQGSLCRMMSLGIGATLAFYERPLRMMSKRTLLMLMSLALLAAGITQLPTAWIGERFTPLSKLIGFTILSGALMAIMVRLRHSRFFPMPMLRAGWLTFIGRISYGLYVYHLPIYIQLDCGPADHTTPLWKNALAIALTFAVAAASFYVIETPILKLKKRFAVKPAQGVPEGADWPAHEPAEGGAAVFNRPGAEVRQTARSGS